MSTTEIEKLLSRKVGISPSIIGSRRIAKAVESRCYSCELPDVETYFKALKNSPQELEELVEEIVVPETWFFRDRKVFEFLINFVHSEYLCKPSPTKLRILSVPCSTGEEPYSIAIALIKAGLSAQQFSIDAIDISKHAIAKAQQAVYGKNSFRGEEFVDRSRYFQQTAEGYKVLPSVQMAVNFQHGNLLNAFSMTLAKYDIIFCRNLLIYLEESACIQVMKIIDRLLVNRGLLFVGAVETRKVPQEKFTSIHHPCTCGYWKNSTYQYEKSKKEISNLPSLEKNLTVKNAQIKASKNQEKELFSSKPSMIFPEEKSECPLEIAKKLAREGQIETAFDYCQKYVSQCKTNAAAYVLLGEIHEVRAEIQQAELCFRKALYLNPSCCEALIELALLKEKQGDKVGVSILQERIQRLQNTY